MRPFESLVRAKAQLGSVAAAVRKGKRARREPTPQKLCSRAEASDHGELRGARRDVSGGAGRRVRRAAPGSSAFGLGVAIAAARRPCDHQSARAGSGVE
eukprot:scaffold699_cov231-Pinguiococcus_pyrenoidosus.AAC.17